MSTPTKIPIPGRTESTEKIPTFKNTSKKFKGNKSRTSIQSRKVTNAINNLSSKRIKKNKAKEIRLDSLKVFHPNFTKAKDVIARQSRKYNHCSSSPTVHYVNKQVFNCSLYIKTLVMAGNNNGE